MKIENSDSQWRFWDLFNKTVSKLNGLLKHYSKGYDQPEFGIERVLIRFLERLPSGDYSNLRNEWNNKEE